MKTGNNDRLRDMGAREKERLRKLARDASQLASDIANVDKYGARGYPKIHNYSRRKSCRYDLHKFLRTYFPHSTGLKPFGAAQINAIKRMEHAVLNGGRYLDLEPRGYVKSTRTENAVIWMTFYQHRQFPLFLGANDEMASIALESIKMEVSENELLMADFPEFCYAARCLDNKSQRCRGQMFKQNLTHIQWTADRIFLPSLAGNGWALMATAGLMAATRGMRHKLPDGTQIRPDFLGIDDPQTDESATSPTMTEKRLRVLTRNHMKLGGHGNQVAAVINATVIAPDDLVDQLASPERHPEWPTVRTGALVSLPSDEIVHKHWLGEYKRIRGDYDPHDPEGPAKARQASTKYYRKHQTTMDDQAEPEWPHVPLESDEISPIQHAMNVWVDDGESTFWAEVMNRPQRPQVASPLDLDKGKLIKQVNGYDRHTVPDGRSYVVFHIDVHDELLYYTVAAVSQDFSGDVIDYGTWPEQRQSWFSLRNAKQKLSTKYRGLTIEQAIERGVQDLLSRLMSTNWLDSTANDIPISCGIVDAGYKSEEVANAIRKSGYRNVFTSRGIGIGPTEKPMSEYDLSKKRVLSAGPDPRRPTWFLPKDQIAGGVRRVHFDANRWKDTLASRLTEEGSQGRWMLFGKAGTEHGPYVEHLTAERPSQVTAKGRTVNVWKVAGNSDNHWWDTAVGCAVAASMSGARMHIPAAPKIKKENGKTEKKTQRRRVRQLSW